MTQWLTSGKDPQLGSRKRCTRACLSSRSGSGFRSPMRGVSTATAKAGRSCRGCHECRTRLQGFLGSLWAWRWAQCRASSEEGAFPFSFRRPVLACPKRIDLLTFEFVLFGFPFEAIAPKRVCLLLGVGPVPQNGFDSSLGFPDQSPTTQGLPLKCRHALLGPKLFASSRASFVGYPC